MARISMFLYVFEKRQWEGNPGASDGATAEPLHDKGHREEHLGTQQGMKTPRLFPA